MSNNPRSIWDKDFMWPHEIEAEKHIRRQQKIELLGGIIVFLFMAIFLCGLVLACGDGIWWDYGITAVLGAL